MHCEATLIQKIVVSCTALLFVNYSNLNNSISLISRHFQGEGEVYAKAAKEFKDSERQMNKEMKDLMDKALSPPSEIDANEITQPIV